MKLLYTLLLMILSAPLFSQVSGRVLDTQGEAMIGVNVFLKGTYTGATTDVEGNFSFKATETGLQVLTASFVGYKTFEQEIDLTKSVEIEIILKEEINRLSAITITAGSFEASDEKKSEVLKPLDIAMTAGATADISGALNKLPGATINGESGRLFVRGGTANETQAYIDGALVSNFYNATPNNVPSRSRFSPFLFKGTFFSTGGYSAEFGQALSSILSLSSNDLPPETRSDISLMSVGGDIAHTQKWETGSVYGQLQYTNLNPYNNLIEQEFDWKQGFTSGNGTFMLRQKVKGDGMIKVYANYDESNFELNMPNINTLEGDDIAVNNKNKYLNVNYRRALSKKGTLYAGLSQGANHEVLGFNTMDVDKDQFNTHAKTYVTWDVSSFGLKSGVEVLRVDDSEKVGFDDGTGFSSEYTNRIIAGFTEVDYFVTNGLTLRAGLRYSDYSLLEAQELSPRLSMAIKTGTNSQISAAFGKFHQLPQSRLMLRSQSVGFERADHYMVSFQSTREGRTFRSEVYHKDYDALVKFDPANSFDPLGYRNNGSGYARGLDLFWRDSKTLKNVDYWITYSYIDSERDFEDYPVLASPTFAARHNLSIVYKQFFTEIKTQIGASYSFNSGRPFNDPNLEGFNQSTTPYYSDLSFNLAHLARPNIIIYASATNLLGRDNIFSYQFEDNPGADNYYDSRAIGQPAKRFLFLGVFITLTKDGTKNNLENL